MSAPSSRGFTLLEVMVSVAILGLGLTAILSAQFSAVHGVSHARYINVAVGLARCKMSEIEEQLRIDGFQELGVSESGPCCEGDEGSGYICSWSVDKPIFPSPDFGELDLDTKLEGTALESLTETSKTGEMPTGENGEIGDLSSLAAGGVGGVAQMLMSMVYPDLKIMFEASTRRVTVSVMWKEGGGDHDLTVMQWVTQPQKGAPPTGSEEDLSGLVPGGGESPASPKAPGNAKTPALGKNPMGGR